MFAATYNVSAAITPSSSYSISGALWNRLPSRSPVPSETTITAAVRNAPRRSPRPERRLRRASSAAAASSANAMSTVVPFSTQATVEADRVATRDGIVHGGTTLKKIGRPRYAAASTRTVTPLRSGSGPSHAARASDMPRGVQSGGTGRRDGGASPAAPESGGPAGATAAAAAGASPRGGDEGKPTSRALRRR